MALVRIAGSPKMSTSNATGLLKAGYDGLLLLFYGLHSNPGL